jgi:pyruvate formate lyase activating enzyme
MLAHAPTPLATLKRARTIAMGNGLRHVYIGNLRDDEGSTTFCTGCGAELIGRQGYEVTALALSEEGTCKSCGTACVGRFAGKLGSWGNRRLPIAIAASE